MKCPSSAGDPGAASTASALKRATTSGNTTFRSDGHFGHQAPGSNVRFNSDGTFTYKGYNSDGSFNY